jgi:hypothetical protein
MSDLATGDRVRLSRENMDLQDFSAHVAGTIVLQRDNPLTVTGHYVVSGFTYYKVDGMEEAFLAHELEVIDG